jgi:hypothetical protein
MIRKPREIRKDIRQKLKELNRLLKELRVLQHELSCTPRFSWYSDSNRGLIGGDGAEDYLYKIGWRDGYKSKYNESQRVNNVL